MPLRSVAQPRRAAAVTDQKRPAGASVDKTDGGHRRGLRRLRRAVPTAAAHETVQNLGVRRMGTGQP